MPVCNHCNAHVSEQFVRVFGRGESDAVLACPNCSANAGIAVTVRERSQ